MKKRFIALTDIYRKPNDRQMEIDDVESMCRLLLYANDIDLEGLIATSSFCYQKGGKEKDRKVILDIIDAYEKVKPNLDIHAEGYPSAESLRRITYCGIPEFGKKLGKGFGHEKYNDNPGVNHIIHVVDKEDDRPVWIGLWGGANTLAQAVWKVWKTRSEDELNHFLSKLRIYGISDQDKGGVWIREMFGDRLFYIVSPSAGTMLGAVSFYEAAWQGMSFDRMGTKKQQVRPEFQGANNEMVTKEWIREHICGTTPYRRIYPVPVQSMEGDTPTYLGLIPNGLNDMEHPNYGGWGGRYEFYLPEKPAKFAKPEHYPIWTDVEDTVLGLDKKIYKNNFATIWRWREAVQYDFLARLVWTETNRFEDAVHPPVVVVDGGLERDVKCGEEVTLSGAQSYARDGKSLRFHWFDYAEAGSYKESLEITGDTQNQIRLKMPKTPGTKHIILEVTAEGEVPVTRYARIILHVVS